MTEQSRTEVKKAERALREALAHHANVLWPKDMEIDLPNEIDAKFQALHCILQAKSEQALTLIEARLQAFRSAYRDENFGRDPVVTRLPRILPPAVRWISVSLNTAVTSSVVDYTQGEQQIRNPSGRNFPLTPDQVDEFRKKEVKWIKIRRESGIRYEARFRTQESPQIKAPLGCLLLPPGAAVEPVLEARPRKTRADKHGEQGLLFRHGKLAFYQLPCHPKDLDRGGQDETQRGE